MKGRTKPRKLISLFSGGGGLDLGLEAAGFQTVFATDIDLHSCNTLSNAKQHSLACGLPFLREAIIRQADINALASQEVLQAANVKPGEVDLLAGGPPCQAFSVFGKRKGVQDDRGLLVFQYLRLLADIQPKAFIFENVFGLLTIENGEVFKKLCKLLERPCPSLSYTLSIFRLNAADYGVPQFRDRVFIIGSRNGKRVSEIPMICGPETPSIKQEVFSYRTVADAFRKLPRIGTVLPNHYGREHSARIVTRYRGLQHGERDSKTRINKLDPSRPSFTIIVGSDKGGGKGHVHPFEPREVSPRESARIQTFPDWWAFSGTSRHPIRQVGNAVPPLLAGVIGREIMKQLLGGEYRSFKELLELLGQTHLFPELSLATRRSEAKCA
jgi:DNA (cytosine-5)-methyltransferase 1